MIYYAVRETMPLSQPRIFSNVFKTQELAQAFIARKLEAGWTHQYEVVKIKRIT